MSVSFLTVILIYFFLYAHLSLGSMITGTQSGCINRLRALLALRSSKFLACWNVSNVGSTCFGFVLNNPICDKYKNSYKFPFKPSTLPTISGLLATNSLVRFSRHCFNNHKQYLDVEETPQFWLIFHPAAASVLILLFLRLCRRKTTQRRNLVTA